MKRFILLLIALLIMTPVCVLANEDAILVTEKPPEEMIGVEILLPETFMTTQWYGEAYADISITNKGKTGEFHLEYSRDNFETVYDGGTYTIGGRETKVVRITENLVKGSYILSARVTSGDAVGTASRRMAVMEEYVRQFGDDYTKVGITLGNVGAYDLKTPRYHTVKDLQINNILLADLAGVLVCRVSGFEVADYVMNAEEPYYKEGLNHLVQQMQATPYLATPITVDGKAAISREAKQFIYDYIQSRVKSQVFKNGKFMLIGNEPDLAKYFPGSDKYGIQYLNVMRNSVFAMRDLTDEYDIMGAGVCSSVNAQGFLEYMFQQDAYKYLDGYDYHPYTSGSTMDERYDSKVKRYEEAADQWGGWLQKRITEMGLTGVWEPGDSDLSTAETATEILKVYLKGFLHDIDFTVWYSLCNNVGIQPINDFTVASEGIASLNNFNKMIHAAWYVGEFPIAEGAQCAMFVRDGEPLMAVWMPGEEPIEYTFNTDVTVDDKYGNPIYTGKDVTIDSDVYFIRNLGKDYVYKTAESVKNTCYAELIEKYGDKIDTTMFDEAKAKDAEYIGKNPLEMVNIHYHIGDRLLTDYIEGKTTLELPEMTTMLHQLQIAGEKLTYVYAMDYDRQEMKISQKYKEVQAAVDKRKNGEKHSTILYTDKILRFSNRFYRKANDLAGREYDHVQAGLVTACSIMSERIAAWAERVMPLEEVDDTIGLLTQCTPVQYNFYQADEYVEIDYSADNRRIKPLDGEIRIMNGAGEQLGEAIPLKLESYEYKELKLKIPNGYDYTDGDMYKVQVWENDKLMNEQWFPVTYQKTISTELENATETVDKLSRVGVKVVNNTPSEFGGTATITPPEGWSFKETSQQFTLEPNETKTVYFELTEKKQTAYNLYSFDVKVEDATGRVLHEKKEMLNFSVVMRSLKEYDPKTFDGNAEDWANAYPLYGDIPEEPESGEAWHEANSAAVSFMKYDENYLYILSNVYDDVFNNKYTGTASWNGDSLQMLIDPFNDKSEAIAADDYQFTISYNKAGYEFLITVGPQRVGDNINADGSAMKTIRDDNLHLTRYLIKVPLSLVGMEGKVGTVFGINICFNESDLEDRQSVYQITPGLAEGGARRSPAKYFDYHMVEYESAKEDDGKGIIDATMGNTSKFTYGE